MALQDYIDKVAQTYSYRFKTIVQLDDAALTVFEDAIRKYRPCHVGKVVKTPIQTQPLDFDEFANREVYIIDFETSLPISSYVLQQEIRKQFGVPEKYIVILSANAPTEIESLRMAAFAEMDAEAEKKGLRPAPLLLQPDYPEVEQVDGDRYYGDKYNANLRSIYNDLSIASREKQNVDAPHPLMKWENMPKAEDQEPKIPKEDFNKNVEIAKPKEDKKARHISAEQNYDDTVRTYSRVYTDGKKTTTLSRTVGDKK